MSAETQQVRELQAVVIFISSSFEFRARGLCQSFTFHTRKESVSLLLWLRLLVPRGLKLSVFKRRNTSRPKNLSFSTGPFIPLFYTGESFECRSQTPEKKEERIPKREFLKHKHTRPKSIYFFFFFLPWGRKRCTIRRGKRDRSGRGNSVWKCPSATKPVEREKKKRKNVKILEEICCCRRQVLIRFGSLVRNVTATWRRNDVWWFRPEFSLFSFTLTTGSARVTATRAVSTAVYRSARADDRHGPEIKNHGDTANSTDLFRLLCFPSLPISFSFYFFKILFSGNKRNAPLGEEGVCPIVCRAFRTE